MKRAICSAVDNINYDPSSTTAQSSFHGTGISITQFLAADNAGTAIEPLATVATQGFTFSNPTV